MLLVVQAVLMVQAEQVDMAMSLHQLEITMYMHMQGLVVSALNHLPIVQANGHQFLVIDLHKQNRVVQWEMPVILLV